MIKRFLLRMLCMITRIKNKMFKSTRSKKGFIERVFDILIWQERLSAYDYESRIYDIKSCPPSVLKEKERVLIHIDRGWIAMLKDNFIEKSIEYLKASGYNVKKCKTSATKKKK